MPIFFTSFLPWSSVQFQVVVILDGQYNYYIIQFVFSSIEKSFELPYFIEIDKINSMYRNGILSITLPKRNEFQNVTKKIISVKK